MIEVLQFIFSSFWVWLGTVILVSAFANVLIAVVAVIRKAK